MPPTQSRIDPTGKTTGNTCYEPNSLGYSSWAWASVLQLDMLVKAVRAVSWVDFEQRNPPRRRGREDAINTLGKSVKKLSGGRH